MQTAGTMNSMTDSWVTPEMRDSVRSAIEDLAREFGFPERGWQGGVAAKMKVTQPTVSDTWKRKKLGLGVLLALRQATGRSIDDLLGLSSGAAPVYTYEQLLSAVRDAAGLPAAPPSKPTAPPPSSTVTKSQVRAGHRTRALVPGGRRRQ